MKRRVPKGLGFLEVIIALSVMIVGVTTGITLTTYNLANVVVAENQVLATGLSREPIELIRALRDSNWLSGTDWHSGIDPSSNYVMFQYFDEKNSVWKLKWVQESDLENCERCNVIYNPDKKMYLQNIDENDQPISGATLTGYRRWTRVKNICWDSGNQKQYIPDYSQSCEGNPMIGWRLTTDVSWYDSQNKKTLTVSEDIYDWR